MTEHRLQYLDAHCDHEPCQ